jgi:hypothetical protein
MKMYQILCGHVHYALGKTRMQVKLEAQVSLYRSPDINKSS